MDTSDSEHFESADEFHSDDENSEDSEPKSVLEDKVKALEKRLDYCNINEPNEKTKVKQSSICRVADGNTIKESPVEKADEVNEIIPKRITDFKSIAGTREINMKQDVESHNQVENQQNRLQDESDCGITKLKIHATNSNKETSNDQLKEFESENMWDVDEWEPISTNNIDPNSGKNSNAKKTLEENAWENDDWEPIENKEKDSDELWQKDEWEPIESQHVTSSHNRDTNNDSSWSGWSSWGVSSILNTATNSVSTLKNQVSLGLSNVLESSMGIPDPEELAKQHLSEEDKIRGVLENVEQNSVREEENVNKNYTRFGFGNLVSGVTNLTKFVEDTGTKVITGGLDTLETIGKKTMEVLQDGDPGLKNKRAFLKLDQDKPVLSQVLREAKEKAEEENKTLQQNNITRKLNYESLFDDYHGLVHLEALEMLSKQCDIKLQTMSHTCSGDALKEILETLEQVRELCELPDEDDEDQCTLEEIEDKIESALREININISYDKGITTWKKAESWLNSLQLNVCDETEIHQEALQVLAQLTAIAVEQFHKAGELLLIKEHRSTADEADSLVQLTTALTCLIGIAAGKFSEKLNVKATGSLSKERINDLITNVFFEAANSSSYIQDAFQLLIPVLQVGTV